jgi:hypothetical protein
VRTTPRRSIVLVFAAALAILPLLGASCDRVDQDYTSVVPSGPTPALAKPKLLFLGDSLFVKSADTFNSVFEPGYEVANHSVDGTTNGAMIATATTTAATHPDIVVIDLAGNDANVAPCVSGVWLTCPPNSSSDFDAAAVEANMTTINTLFTNVGACVVWVTGTTDHDPTWHPDHEAVLDQFEQTTFPHIADWGAAYQPGFYDQLDDPHPNVTGQQALSGVIAQAIAGCP